MEVALRHDAMLPASVHEAANILEFRKHMLAAPQTPCKYKHLIHGGMYVRTIYTPPKQFIAGVKLRVPTVTITIGSMTIYREGDNLELKGYNILPGSAGRMVACMTHTAAIVTMILPTKLDSVIDIQNQSVEEPELLPQILDPEWHSILVTGE